MAIVLGALLALFLVLFTVAALTGRVLGSSCCAVADPRRDLRMRDAFPRDVS